MKKDILGYVCVDSGQVIIIDPCYLHEWKDGESDDKKSHYVKCCDITLSKKRGGEVLVSGVAGNGVVSGTYYGDGVYPVYAKRDKGGRIESLEIVFN